MEDFSPYPLLSAEHFWQPHNSVWWVFQGKMPWTVFEAYYTRIHQNQKLGEKSTPRKSYGSPKNQLFTAENDIHLWFLATTLVLANTVGVELEAPE